MTVRTLLAVPLLALLAPPLHAAAPDPARHTAGVVAEVPFQIETAERVGRADADRPVERMMLVLPSRDRLGRDRFLAAQQTPGTAEWHRWLLPAEFHARFGADPASVSAAVSWLKEQGFAVEEGNAGRSIVLFSGSVAQVEAAFATRMGLYAKDGQAHLANEVPATMPAFLAGRVVGLVSLHGFSRRQPLSRPGRLLDPLYTNGSSHYLAPADFATIYGLAALSGGDGTGRKIAVVGRTQVNLADTQFFRSFFALPANDPQVVLNGPDPGFLSQDEQFEANLDMQWSGATAPAAKVLFVVSKGTAVADGVDLSSQYAVEQNLADAVTVSFGACESDIGEAGMAFYEDIWAQAAAQGMSVFVASGDSGAAGCEVGSASQGTVAAVNGLSSTPWNTCVGGTMFLDKDNPSAYWISPHDPTTKGSARSYIPEAVWNESATVPGGSRLYGAGGGRSITFTKPAWQAGPGVPEDGRRDVPDVSLASAAHNGYLVFLGHTGSTSGLYIIYGTSAASPAFAGIAAVLAQKTGGRLGNMNPVLYALGRGQYGGTGPAVFHDVTSGNNSVPNVTGFAAGTGYDLGSGLGSVDVAALAAAWPSAAPPANADFLLGVSPGALVVGTGKSANLSVVLTTVSALDAIAQVTVTGLPSGVTAAFQPSQASNEAVGYASAGVPANLMLTVASTAATGTYPITLTGTAGTVRRTVTLYLTISSATAVPPTSGTETQVPVVLDVFGAAGSHYTSDLVAVNRTAGDVTVQLRYVAAPGTSGTEGRVVSRSLPAGRQLTVPDVVAFLRASGYSLATDASAKLGTLFVNFTGVTDPSLVFAGSRTSTPNRNTAVGGAFGTFSAGIPDGSGNSAEVFVYGLKENESFRSNLAVVHAPGGSSSLGVLSPLGVEVQVFDGATGAASGSPVSKTLQPGEFWQINSVLGSVRNGYVRVRRTSGADRFIAYGVVNDGGATGSGTSDGSLVVSGGTEGLIPIVLDIPGGTHYQTEVSLTNTSASSVNVSLTYTASTLFGAASFSASANVTLGAGQQLQQSNAVTWLRGLGIPIPTTGSQGGTLRVSGAVALARTWNPNPDPAVGGTFGVAYPAIDAAHRATTGAWVYGLRQDSDVRTNLALADARVGDASTREYTIQIFDADTGSTTPAATITRTLAGGQWTQIDGVLNGTGVSHGYARVRPTSGSSDFIAYGVVNDGPTPGSRTSDGSYLPMVVGN